MYTGGLKWLSQLLSWASTLIVVRLLSPEDYGIVGMASVYIGLMTLANDFGLGAAIVTHHELTDDQVAQLNTFAVLIGLTLFAVSCVAAVPLAGFFSTPELQSVVVTMSLAFVISAFQTVPSALLQRDLQFKSLAVFDGFQAFVLALATVFLAFVGFRYWTLVYANLLGAGLLAAMVLAKRPHRFAWPRAHSLAKALTFSSQILVARLAWYVQSTADFVVAGRVLGQSALGIYSVGWTLASVPVDKISSLTARVMPGFFAAVQTDMAALRRYLLMLTEALALITIPLAWGLALVADDFVLLFLGERWQAVTVPLRILAVLASLRPMVTLLPHVLNVTGESRFSMVNGVIGVVVLPAGFFVGSQWGLIGIAAAWLLLYPLVVFPLYWVVFRKIDMTAVQYLRAVGPALICAIAMATAVTLVRLSLGPASQLPLRFLLEVAVGGAVYVSFLAILYRSRTIAILQFLRVLRPQREPLPDRSVATL
jgi:PST family polysaccharide transporter